MNNENKIPEEIIVLIQKNWKGHLKNPMDKILNYVYNNNILEWEYKRQKLSRSNNITDEINGLNINGIIDYLKNVPNPEYTRFEIDEYSLYLVWCDKETDAEYADRLFHNVISPTDRLLSKEKNNKKNLLKEKQELEARLRKINSML